MACRGGRHGTAPAIRGSGLHFDQQDKRGPSVDSTLCGCAAAAQCTGVWLRETAPCSGGERCKKSKPVRSHAGYQRASLARQPVGQRPACLYTRPASARGQLASDHARREEASASSARRRSCSARPRAASNAASSSRTRRFSSSASAGMKFTFRCVIGPSVLSSPKSAIFRVAPACPDQYTAHVQEPEAGPSLKAADPRISRFSPVARLTTLDSTPLSLQALRFRAGRIGGERHSSRIFCKLHRTGAVAAGPPGGGAPAAPGHASFTASKGRYGSPRIHRDLRDDHQERVSRKRVIRLMQADGAKRGCASGSNARR